MLEEKRASHNISFLAYHIVWIPKYRRWILVGPVAAASRELIDAKASGMSWRIVVLEIMPITYTSLFRLMLNHRQVVL